VVDLLCLKYLVEIIVITAEDMFILTAI